jgi:hypothetical protein
MTGNMPFDRLSIRIKCGRTTGCRRSGRQWGSISIYYKLSAIHHAQAMQAPPHEDMQS